MTYRTVTTSPTPIDALGVTTTTDYPAKPINRVDKALVAAAVSLSAALAIIVGIQPHIATSSHVTAVETRFGYELIYPTPQGERATWYSSGETVIDGVVIGAR